MWFHSWFDLIRIVLVGSAGYFTLVGVLRVSGKRTLSQLNVFDFVVTVALGSILATVLLNADVSWAEGAVAFALIAGLQMIVAVTISKWPPARRAVTSTAVLLVKDGVIRTEVLRQSRLTESEIHQAIRSSGHGAISDIAAVVLETNGKISVITAANYGDGSAMEGLQQ